MQGSKGLSFCRSLRLPDGHPWLPPSFSVWVKVPQLLGGLTLFVDLSAPVFVGPFPTSRPSRVGGFRTRAVVSPTVLRRFESLFGVPSARQERQGPGPGGRRARLGGYGSPKSGRSAGKWYNTKKVSVSYRTRPQKWLRYLRNR